WKDRGVWFAKNLALPHLAAVLEPTIFVGHDSGISHLAAAAGANCILLFGPTDPNVWAPRNENVRVLQAQSGSLNDLDIAEVRVAVTTALRPARSGTQWPFPPTCNTRPPGLAAGVVGLVKGIWSFSGLNLRSRLEISRAISTRSG